MNDFFKNRIVQSIIASLIVAFLIWLISWLRSNNDTKKIISYMEESREKTSHVFKSTHAISSAINISEEKVRKICSKNTKIKRNEKEKEKESWRLIDS